MLSSRRDLLKLFGIGTTIIPVVGGVPEIQAPAQLIEIPKVAPVELAPAPPLPEEMFGKMDSVESIFVSVRFKDQTALTFEAEGFGIGFRRGDPYPLPKEALQRAKVFPLNPPPQRCDWTLRGHTDLRKVRSNFAR